MILRKCQKSPFFGPKCAYLVTLYGVISEKSELTFQFLEFPKTPDMYILGHKMLKFGFFSNFLPKKSHFCLVTLSENSTCQNDLI